MYSRKGCVAWRLNRATRLLVLTDEDNLKRLTESKIVSEETRKLVEIETGYGIDELDIPGCEYGGKPKNKISICTHGYLNESAFEKQLYTSINLAYHLCREEALEGIDGWWIPPGYDRAPGASSFPQRSDVVAPSFFHDGGRRGHFLRHLSSLRELFSFVILVCSPLGK